MRVTSHAHVSEGDSRVRVMPRAHMSERDSSVTCARVSEGDSRVCVTPCAHVSEGDSRVCVCDAVCTRVGGGQPCVCDMCMRVRGGQPCACDVVCTRVGGDSRVRVRGTRRPGPWAGGADTRRGWEGACSRNRDRTRVTPVLDAVSSRFGKRIQTSSSRGVHAHVPCTCRGSVCVCGAANTQHHALGAPTVGVRRPTVWRLGRPRSRCWPGRVASEASSLGCWRTKRPPCHRALVWKSGLSGVSSWKDPNPGVRPTPHDLPQAPPPNSITYLGVRAPTWRCGGTQAFGP